MNPTSLTLNTLDVLGQQILAVKQPGQDEFYLNLPQVMSVVGEDFSQGLCDNERDQEILSDMGFSFQVRTFDDENNHKHYYLEIEDCYTLWLFCAEVKNNPLAQEIVATPLKSHA